MDLKPSQLSRRERQIMNVIFERSQATAAEVHQALPDAPSYSAVRALLRILEEKGHLKHRVEGPRYVYFPATSREKASRSALQQVVQTFFHGSPANAVAALVDAQDASLTEDDFNRLEALIKKARKS